MPISIDLILKASSLSQISRLNGTEYTQGAIIYLITNLCEFFNFQRNMDGKQIAQTAGLIIELYPHFKAEDIALCFKNIKMIKYGKLYEGLDGSKILEFLNLYDIERQDEIINHRIKESEKHKGPLKPEEYSQEYVDLLKSISESTKPDSPKVFSINEANKKAKGIFQIYEDDFYAEAKKGTDTRFINYKDKMRSLEEYCNLRFEEDHYSNTNNPNE